MQPQTALWDRLYITIDIPQSYFEDALLNGMQIVFLGTLSWIIPYI